MSYNIERHQTGIKKKTNRNFHTDKNIFRVNKKPKNEENKIKEKNKLKK